MEKDNSDEGQHDLASTTRAFIVALGSLTRAVTRETGKDLPGTLRETSEQLSSAAAKIKSTTEGIRDRDEQDQTKAERTRVEIIDVAQRVFAKKRYESVAVADIVAGARFTEGVPYANFPSKTALFLTALYDLERQQDEFMDECRQVNQVPDFLCAGDYSESGGKVLFISMESWVYTVCHPESRKELGAILSKTKDGVAELIARNEGRNQAAEKDGDTTYTALSINVPSSVADTMPDSKKMRTTASRLFS